VIRFGAQVLITSQFDDDFFVYIPQSNINKHTSQTATLRDSLKLNLDLFPTVSQFYFVAYWFGACNASSTSDAPFIIEESLRAYPIYEKLVWRYDSIGPTIPWVKKNRPKNLITIISFTLTSRITSARMSHMWHVHGPSRMISPQCIVYNHYKVFIRSSLGPIIKRKTSTLG
jgi:hypothetical protein